MKDLRADHSHVIMVVVDGHQDVMQARMMNSTLPHLQLSSFSDTSFDDTYWVLVKPFLDHDDAP